MMINKKEFLKRFKDIEQATKVYEKLNEALKYSYTTYTDIYVTPNIWKQLPDKYYDVEIKMVGYDRKKIIFVVDNMYYDDIINLKIMVNNKFKEVSHKEFLGSIMSLNIKREYLSDLFVRENICYFSTSENIANIIMNELKYIGKNECLIEKINEINLSYDYEDIGIISSSLRIDGVLKNILKVSREMAIKYIENSFVQIDYEIIKDKSKNINENDIITIRKNGKYIVDKIEINKKGKYKINLKKYK